MTKLIIFLIRTRLGLKKGERFQFANQKSTMNKYYFTDTELRKEHFENLVWRDRPSNVKLNYILSNKCKIVKEEKLSWC
jgi:hypothetical protein